MPTGPDRPRNTTTAPPLHAPVRDKRRTDVTDPLVEALRAALGADAVRTGDKIPMRNRQDAHAAGRPCAAAQYRPGLDHPPAL